MVLYDADGNRLHDVILTKAAEHEEELMKSDFVKLSWDDAVCDVIPVDAYIIPFKDGLHYSLLEPYKPEQKSGAQFHYEPHFQHPKMYLGKVTFSRPTKDSDANDINLLDWPYTGDIQTLLGYFCDQMNAVYHLEGKQAFGYQVIGEIDNVVNTTFSTVDILSALSNVANLLKCEWHIDWERKTLYFGHIMFSKGEEPLLLEVDKNIGIPSVRNTKDGYWNAFEAQGSSRNITRRAASGEYVQANVRLSLNRNDYSDGIIYSLGERDSEGKIITYDKEHFDLLGMKPYVKSLIFENVYPHLDLYAYNIKYRERYRLDDNNEKVIDHYDADNNPVYKRYAVWYMRLAYPEKNAEGEVTEWHDYDITEVRDMSVIIKKILINSTAYHNIEMTLDIDATASLFTNESKSYGGTYIVSLTADNITIKGYINGSYLNQGECRFYAEYTGDTPEDDRDEPSLANLTAFQNAIFEGKKIAFAAGVDKSRFPVEYSQIIDGKSLYGQFKANTTPNAETSPLAGRGDGDNGNYGFGLIALGIEGENYISVANTPPTEEGDTGIVDALTGASSTVDENYYEIVFQEQNDYILPTTKSQGIIPKGLNEPSLLGNIVNLYNIVMDTTADKPFETAAQKELESETEKYIDNLFTDNNSYTFKSDPIAFEEMFREDEQQGERDSHLFIGQQVRYADNVNYTAENPLLTRVMKIVTKMDYDFEQEITIGNEVIKGSQTQLKEQVQTLISGGGSGTGGGMSESGVLNIVKDYVNTRFLSKTDNDTAQGEIGFLKGLWIKTKGLFGFDADGNGSLNSLTLKDELRAAEGIMNTVRSSNYTGDGIADTGFRLTSDDGTGSSALTVDNLHVRKKATFEELEVKKETAIAGNQVYSSAANIIVKTDFINESGEVVGYVYRQVPWLLKKMPFLLKGVFFGRNRKTKKTITSEELKDVKAFRLYFLAEDDDREIDNMWAIGDLARCQTINMKSSKRNTYVEGSSKIGNVYWWRKVIRVSSNTEEPSENPDTTHCQPALIDGKVYHWFDVSNVDGGYDEGSDIPAAGDHVVQFGNDRTTNRQNIITLDVSNADSPALKFYHDINDFSLANKRIIGLLYNPNTGVPIIEDYGDAFIGARDNSTYIKYDSLNKLLEVKARISAQSTIGNQALDTYINNLITAITDDIELQLDKKAETWYQNADPSSAWNTDELKAEHVGDLWYKTGNGTTWYYKDKGQGASPRYDWEQQNIPQSVFDTIDGKSNIYVNWGAWGNNLHVRDLFIPNDNTTQSGVVYKKGKVYRCTNVSPVTFEEIDYTDDSALNDFKANQYVQALTGGQISQGISNAAGAAATAQSAAETAQSAANEAATAASNAANAASAAQTSANTANNRLNNWASDGKISPQEKTSLKQQKNDIVQEYSQICSEADKYSVSKTAFVTAYGNAITAFDKYTASSPEDITIESDYENISAYYTARTTIMNAIATAAKKVADDAQAAADDAYSLAKGAKNKVDLLDTIKDALNGATLIDGGLLLTSLIALRHYKGTGDKEDVENYNTYGGMNGIYLNDSTIAAWFGGSMEDRYNSSTQTYDTTNSGKATSLFRMDGSGYFARGNFNWDNAGNVNVKNGYFEGKVTSIAEGKGRWEIAPSAYHTATTSIAIPTITGYDKDGRSKIKILFDGDSGDGIDISYGGGLFFVKQESGIDKVDGGYFRNYWRTQSSENSSFIDAFYNSFYPIIESQYPKDNNTRYTLKVGSDDSGACLYSNSWPTRNEAYPEGRVYVDDWGYLKVLDTKNYDRINIRTKSFTLPKDPPVGTIFIIKNMSDSMILKASSNAYVLNGSDDVALIEPGEAYTWNDRTSALLFYLGDIPTYGKCWSMIYSN
ncbi:hypothetical protein SAMN04487851_11446 [Prevotella sp. tc2-28]|uniref:hypothetical protein n=1 Tax=Prevotella sp. tc2-28 TaxID=1761888 RepID=UPI000899E142|nr:hypothetical protein [Prevotella sp. tc2-28]SEA79351.1 hypothetical protein SAMN04487851_11446 [Prevotella sp. tc2-28]